MPRRWHQVGGVIRQRRWQPSPVTGKSTKETVKTIARGMRGVSGVTVVTTLVCFLIFACEAAGASRARHSLRPLMFQRAGHSQQNSGTRREIVEVCFNVMYGRPPVGKAFFGVFANGSGSGHVYGLEMRPVAAGPDGERGSNSNHCGALLRAMTVRSVSIPVS